MRLNKKRLIAGILGLAVLITAGVLLVLVKKNHPKADSNITIYQPTSISGQITDTTGKPMSGIIVSFNDVGVMTDSKGWYFSSLSNDDQQRGSALLSFRDLNNKIYQVADHEASVSLPAGENVVQNFTIEPVESPSPSPHPSPNAPSATINSFTVDHDNISTATTINLYYNVTNIKSAVLDNGIGALGVSGNTAVGSKNVSVSKTTTFTLTVVGLDGKTVTRSQTVTFTTAKPSTPAITSSIVDPVTIQLNWTLPVALTSVGDGIILSRTNPDGTTTPIAVGNAATTYIDTHLSPSFNNQVNNYVYRISIKHNGVSSDIATSTANLTLSSDTTLQNPTNFVIKKNNGQDKLTWSQKGTKPNGYLLMDGRTPLTILSGAATSTTLSLASGHTITLYGYNKQPGGFSASIPASAKAP